MACLCDAQGKNLFNEADIPAITAKSSKALDRIFARSIKLNGISREDIEEIKKG